MAGEDEPKIIDGLPLVAAAEELKVSANSFFKEKKYNDAVSHYERGIAILDKADGHPMLRSEVEQMVSLKAVLYGNMTQCLLNLELWRRAVDAATTCLSYDDGNVKALYRRSQAHEHLKHHGAALKDLVQLQRLGGGALSEEALKERIGKLKEAIAAIAKAREEEESEDEIGEDMVRLKKRFDEIVEKYDFYDGEAAGEVADWLTSGEWVIEPRRVANRWKMELEDAADFLKWIGKGIEFKVQNADANAAQAQNGSSLLG